MLPGKLGQCSAMLALRGLVECLSGLVRINDWWFRSLSQKLRLDVLLFEMRLRT